MDNIEFRKEIHNYIDTSYDEFCKYQDIALEILVEFDRICQKNDFEYFLAYGTMLGAIRDSNQIPWDYDVDTFVKYYNLSRLIQILKQDLGEDYYYDYSDKNSKYPAPCLRICKKGYNMMAIHVDVFFLIGTPNNENKRLKFQRKAESVIRLRTSKYIYMYIKERPHGSIKKMYVRLLSFIYKCVPSYYLRFKEKRILEMYDAKTADFLFSFQDTYKMVYPRSFFESTVRIIMGGHQFNVPSRFEDYLTLNYGNWNKYFPIKNRFEEFYKMKIIVDERQARYKENSRDE